MNINTAESLSLKQLSAIEMLELNELEIARMYKTFGRYFPDQKQFWKAREDEEIGHASLIHTFGKSIQAIGWGMSGHEFNIIEIKYSVRKVQNYLRNFDETNIDLRTVLERAVETEQDLLEHHLFDVDDAGLPELRTLIEKLKTDTTRHMEEFKRGLQRVISK